VLGHELAERRWLKPLVPFHRQAELASHARKLGERGVAELRLKADDVAEKGVVPVELGRVWG
jgi:hypothetical protein